MPYSLRSGINVNNKGIKHKYNLIEKEQEQTNKRQKTETKTEGSHSLDYLTQWFPNDPLVEWKKAQKRELTETEITNLFRYCRRPEVLEYLIDQKVLLIPDHVLWILFLWDWPKTEYEMERTKDIARLLVKKYKVLERPEICQNILHSLSSFGNKSSNVVYRLREICEEMDDKAWTRFLECGDFLEEFDVYDHFDREFLKDVLLVKSDYALESKEVDVVHKETQHEIVKLKL
jgi:hypothetical protein